MERGYQIVRLIPACSATGPEFISGRRADGVVAAVGAPGILKSPNKS